MIKFAVLVAVPVASKVMGIKMQLPREAARALKNWWMSAELSLVRSNQVPSTNPLVFSRKICCPGLVPGLKLPWNGFVFHSVVGAGAAMLYKLI